MRSMSRFTFIAFLVVCGSLLSGCGCAKKNVTEEEATVIRISVAPEPSPTPLPSDLYPDAVSQNGGTTMVNSYIAAGNTPMTKSQQQTLETAIGGEPASDSASASDSSDETYDSSYDDSSYYDESYYDDGSYYDDTNGY